MWQIRLVSSESPAFSHVVLLITSGHHFNRNPVNKTHIFVVQEALVWGTWGQRTLLKNKSPFSTHM